MAKDRGRNWYQSIHFDKLFLVGKRPFAILMRQYHERNIKHFPASKQPLVEQWLIGVEKSCKMLSP